MAYYLRHYFDPDFNHQGLAPKRTADGESALYYLGYVQNVVAGQVLAEIINLEEHPEFQDYEPRFIFNEPPCPCGPNCSLHPGNPNRLIATCNGYAFYHEGLITVKKMLNVRGDLDFNTGNILFVGDVAVHGMIKSGFSLKANNVLIKGVIEGGSVKAQGDVSCESGVYGSENSIIRSGGNVHLKFCENAQIRAKGNVVVEGACLHSTIYVGGTLVVKGRLLGGNIYANNTIYVEGKLGGSDYAATRVFMGYDPFEDLNLRELDNVQLELRKVLQKYQTLVAGKGGDAEQNAATLALVQRKRAIVRERQHFLWKKFGADAEREKRCRLIAQGEVSPGLELAIGTAVLHTERNYKAVEFRLLEDEIAITPTVF